MDDYLERAKALELCGIQAEHWLDFFSIFREQQDEAAISEEIEKLRGKLASSVGEEETPRAESLRQIIAGLYGLLDE